MTIKISTVDELEKALPVLHKLEPSPSSYGYIRNNLPRFICMHQNYYNYQLLDISALYNLEETNPELFI